MPQRKTPTGCRPASLMGLWFALPSWMESAMARVQQCDLAALAKEYAKETAAAELAADRALADVVIEGADKPAERPPYLMADNGVAVFTISGPTTKYPTSFGSMLGGTSTVEMQRALRLAKADPAVKRGLIHFEDTPGGTLAGAFELRDDIRAFAAEKPIDAHATDLCCSAGMLFSTATGGRITANQTAVLGSIGTRAMLVDSSEKYAKEGIKVIPVTAGKFKAAGAPGTKITDEHVAELQKNIDEMNDLFIVSVCEDRKQLTPEHVRGLEARTFSAKGAVENKLIDGICSFEQALSAAVETAGKIPATTEPITTGATAMTFIELLRASLKLPADASEAAILAAADRLSTQSTELAARVAKLPAAMPPDVLNAHLGVAVERINLAVDKGLPTPVAEALKNACGQPSAEGAAATPSALMLTPSAELGGKRPVEFMLAQFALIGESTAGKAKDSRTATQTINRQVPGTETAAAGGGTMTAEQLWKSGQDAAANFSASAVPGNGAK